MLVLQWGGLTYSLVSAVSAILVSQWLKRYAVADTNGTAANRCWNRQHRFDKINALRVRNFIDLLLIWVQASFCFLNLGVSIHLFGADLGGMFVIIPSTPILVYIYMTIRGVFAPNFPYQTPLSSVFRRFIGFSFSRLFAFPKHFVVTYPRRAKGSFPNQEPDQLDIRCVSWILQVSVKKGVQLLAMEHLATMETLVDLESYLVESCFNVFIDCVNVIDGDVVVVRGLERLATVSAICFFRTLSHLLATDPTSEVLEDIRWRYDRIFPLETNFQGLPFYYTLGAIHRLFNSDQEHPERPRIEWQDYKPPRPEHTKVSHALAELARSECRKRDQKKKVPRWIIRFALHSLSLDPLPPTPVVVDCLSVIATDLGCQVPSTRITASSKKCVLTPPDT